MNADTMTMQHRKKNRNDVDYEFTKFVAKIEFQRTTFDRIEIQ